MKTNGATSSSFLYSNHIHWSDLRIWPHGCGLISVKMILYLITAEYIRPDKCPHQHNLTISFVYGCLIILNFPLKACVTVPQTNMFIHTRWRAAFTISEQQTATQLPPSLCVSAVLSCPRQLLQSCLLINKLYWPSTNHIVRDRDGAGRWGSECIICAFGAVGEEGGVCPSFALLE